MRLTEIQGKIAAACAQAGRTPSGVTLVAVTKGRTAQEILPLLEAGHLDFAESRVQDALEKWPDLKKRFPAARLHFIGRVQTNKAEEIASLFDSVHTLDSARAAEALKTAMQKTSRALPCFVQVNTGEEPQKGGVAPRDLQVVLRDIRAAGIVPQGLMCLPPAEDIPALHFALLAKLAKEEGLQNLSMGMSADYETALRLGATHVRIGSALFSAT